jgi:hypothetical protein
MKKDLQLFTDTINFLVLLTTKDEYGTIRSRGIDTYSHLAEELNDIGIIPKGGAWNENSLKCFFRRIERRYAFEERYENCDLDFIGRHTWEYQSGTLREEVCEVRHGRSHYYPQSDSAPSKPKHAYTRMHADINNWKCHEIDEINTADKKVINDYNNFKSRTRISNS